MTKDEQSRLLTAEDILRGGEAPLERLEIPELQKGGRPGVVHLRPLPAGAVLEFAQHEEGAARNAAMLELIAHAVVTPEGKPLFTREQAAGLRELSIQAFNRLARAVTAMAQLDDEAGPQGNV